MWRIAFSGPEYIGKTTLVTEITEELERNQIDFVPLTNVARTMFKEAGYTRDDFKHVAHFQDMIFNYTKEVDAKYASECISFLADRSPLDMAAYALYWCGRDRSKISWLNDYIQKCMQQAKAYTKIYLLPWDRITNEEFEEDNMRSSQPGYRQCIEVIMRGLATKYLTNVTTLDLPTNRQVVNYIVGFVLSYEDLELQIMKEAKDGNCS